MIQLGYDPLPPPVSTSVAAKEVAAEEAEPGEDVSFEEFLRPTESPSAEPDRGEPDRPKAPGDETPQPSNHGETSQPEDAEDATADAEAESPKGDRADASPESPVRAKPKVAAAKLVETIETVAPASAAASAEVSEAPATEPLTPRRVVPRIAPATGATLEEAPAVNQPAVPLLKADVIEPEPTNPELPQPSQPTLRRDSAPPPRGGSPPPHQPTEPFGTTAPAGDPILNASGAIATINLSPTRPVEGVDPDPDNPVESRGGEVPNSPEGKAATVRREALPQRVPGLDLRPSETLADLELNPTAHGDAKKSTSEPAQRVQFVQRVARAFRASVQRGGPVRMRLHPPELGAVRLEVSLRDGALHARVEAETSAARSLLLESLPQLRERLTAQEIKIDRFEVDVMNQSTGDWPQRARDQHQHHDRHEPVPRPRAGTRERAEEQGPTPTSRPGGIGQHIDQRINVVV